MTLLLDFHVGVLTAGALLAMRQLAIVLASEQGRKQDLRKRLYKANHDFQVCVLIPYRAETQKQSLVELLKALDDQQPHLPYLSIQLVTTEATFQTLDADILQQNVQVWTYPEESPVFDGAMTQWLIDRCLASGLSGMYVFLKPQDIVKADFLQNVLAKSLDCSVMQGYLAVRRFPKTPLAVVATLHNRLLNRIHNAGKYHLGLSARILDSGWAIKSDVLERIPYARGRETDNIEYNIRLSLGQVRVNWAPNVMVYRDEPPQLGTLLWHGTLSFIDRIRLFVQYGALLLGQALLKMNFECFDLLLSLFKPSAFMLGLFLAGISVYEALPPVGEPAVWISLFIVVLTLHFLSLFVARCRLADYGATFFWTPWVYLSGMACLPWVWMKALLTSFQASAQNVGGILGFRKNSRYLKGARFNEAEAHSVVEHSIINHSGSPQSAASSQNARYAHSQASPVFNAAVGSVSSSHSSENFLEDGETYSKTFSGHAEPAVSSSASFHQSMASEAAFYPSSEAPVTSATNSASFSPRNYAAYASTSKADSYTSLTAENTPFPEVSVADPDPLAMLPRDEVFRVPLSNGQKQVLCTIRVRTQLDESGEEVHQMTLEYKRQSFSSSAYRILDQAFYELQSKLMVRGLTLITCGSCGYYYNPTADIPETVKSGGVCLFGKNGQDVSVIHDAVTVMSQACHAHCSINRRETLLNQWQSSLIPSSVRSRSH